MASTRAMHWIAAILVLATMPIGVMMQQEGLSRETGNLLYILHKNGGVIIFLLVIARIVWRVLHPAPPMPLEIAAWQAQVARAAHWALYGVLMLMAISGYVRVRAGGFPIEMLDALGVPPLVPRSETLEQTAQSIHSTLRFVLAGLILAHVGAAIQHLVRRDGVFGRIWPPFGR